MTRLVDPRLREAVAMALCWAEFSMHEDRPTDETPASNWAALKPYAQASYYADAELHAQAMMGLATIVPISPTRSMIDAARQARPALRADAHVRDVWNAMLQAREKVAHP